ncbi:MAG: ABC transporter ATP-binding protein [Desulfobacterales bacterium]|uniref:ABC transporter ATP-binding protein n=1 Tax=Candidatus Desulfatibia profunda TaxID=2841695 RepID=A0A8J6NRF3_9BACT|nr:ABC transporter ATP-binding protein [Candidatus Desulfatibia profunda]MBL7180988.1 ABC transporter ATP-binding protein [Desulfobacterales bacterium]
MHTDFGYFEETQLGKPYDVKMLGRLYPYIKPYKPLLFLSIILVVGITLLDLSMPYVTKIAIDRYIVPQIRPVHGKDRNRTNDNVRYLRADLTDAEIKAVVQKYPDRFKRYGSLALAKFDDLDQFEKNDLAILRKGDLAGVGMITAAFLAIVLVMFALNVVQVMLMEYAGQMIMHDLRVGLFEHIQRLSAAFFTRNPVGRLVTRVANDIQNMYEFFTSVIVFVFRDLFLLLGITAVLLGLNWQLALVSFMVLPVVIAASIHFAGQAREAFRILRIKLAEINTKFSETIGGIRVIQLFLQEKANCRNFAELNHEHYLAGMRQVHVFAVFMPVIELLGAVAIAIVIYYGGGRVLDDSISLGALVAFISYMKMFFRPIRDIAEKYNILQNAMASAERIFFLLDNSEILPQPAPADEFSSTPGIKSRMPARRLEKITEIAFKDVSLAYVKGETVLNRVSFRVSAGETVALVGPTGSGKTSIINLIARFYDPSSGQVLLNGVNIEMIPTFELRQKLALVTQDPFLFSETIRDNIALGKRDITKKELRQIIRDSNCETLVDRLPRGVDTVLSEGGMSLSSGERQLISIARAFARNPDLILLDEATSYIDSSTERHIQRALFNLMANRTAIVVAHRLSTAREADRIIVLNRGRIIEAGTHSELMQRQGFYFRLYKLQN